MLAVPDTREIKKIRMMADGLVNMAHLSRVAIVTPQT